MVLLPVAMLLVPEPMVLGAAEPAPIAPALLLSAPGDIDEAPEELDGVVAGGSAGLLTGGGITTGVLLSSTFLPQAPRANKVERATAVSARDL